MALRDFIAVKYGALLLLVLQNTLLVIAMRYSRVSEGPMYAASTAVFSMEVIKFICCNIMVLYQYDFSFGKYGTQLTKECTLAEMLKLSVPSLLYTVQNNLLYFALSNLDATTYQVCYQTKILTTAVFSSVMLGRTLSMRQWFSLLILTIGVSIAQLSASQVSTMYGGLCCDSTSCDPTPYAP
jgi:UDP-sugar transporter A1/2/3